jgi:hypothetical protein
MPRWPSRPNDEAWDQDVDFMNCVDGLPGHVTGTLGHDSASPEPEGAKLDIRPV